MVVFGHSHAADGGATITDYGAIHKLSGMIHPARLRTAAIGGAICSWHNAATVGDGGWGTVFDQIRRYEQSQGVGNTTLNASYTQNASSISVAERAGLYAGQFIVVGTGTATETMQVATSYTPTTGAGSVTLNARLSDGLFSTSAHSSGDGVWNDPITYQAKDLYALLNYGANDVPANGPNPVTYNGAGNSAGFVPLQNAMRACLARIRLAVFYDPNHTSSKFAGTWAASLVAGAALCQFTSVTSGGQTITINTPPSFKGGTVDIFSMCDAAGSGGTADYAVTGATTVGTQSAALNSLNVNAYNKNQKRDTPGGAGKNTPTVLRIKNLNAGVNTITVTAHPAAGNGTGGLALFYYLGWGIEAPSPPVISVLLDPRTLDYALWGTWPYSTRLANTFASLSGTTITLQSAYVQGVYVTGTLASYYPGDTISFANGDVRVITATPSTTTVTIDSALSSTPSVASKVVVGLQDADITGGMPATNGSAVQSIGPANESCYSAITKLIGGSVVTSSGTTNYASEFDQYVVPTTIDDILKKTSTNFIWDRAHYNDYGHALVAPRVYDKLQSQTLSTTQIASPTVPDKRVWLPVQGNGLAPPAFLNSWVQYAQQVSLTSAVAAAATTIPVSDRTGFNPGDVIMFDDGGLTEVATIVSTYVPATGAGNLTTAAIGQPHPANCLVRHADPQFGYYKDFPTGLVFIRGAIKGGTSAQSNIIQLPAGFRPSQSVPVSAIGQGGSAAVIVDPQGFVSGGPDAHTLYTAFYDSYPVEL